MQKNKLDEFEEEVMDKFDRNFDLDDYGESHIVQEKVKMSIRTALRKQKEMIVEMLEDNIKLQGAVLQTEIGDSYMHGIANGLITAKAIIQNEEQPLFEELGGTYKQVVPPKPKN